MAIGTLLRANPDALASAVTSITVRSNWIIVNDDAETAQSAAMLLAPATITDSTFHWCMRGPAATNVSIRARYNVGATVTTDPVVRIYGAWLPGVDLKDETAVATALAANDGTVQFLRLDLGAHSGTGITLDLVTSGASSFNDGTYAYSNPNSSTGTNTGFPMLGCDAFGVVVSTAANVSAGVVAIQALMY